MQNVALPQTFHVVALKHDLHEVEVEGRANFAAKSALLIEAVAQAEKLEATDADVDAKFQELADARGEQVEAVRGHFGKEGAIEDLKARLVEEKTLDWLMDQAKLVKAKAPAKKKAAAKAKAERGGDFGLELKGRVV